MGVVGSVFDEIKAISASFHRYILRYGPSTGLTCVFLFPFFENSLVRLRADNVSFGAAIVFYAFVCICIEYLFTWPALLMHIFRFDGISCLDLSKQRQNEMNRQIGILKCDTVETVDTYRHVREFGNAFIGAGATVIQARTLLVFFRDLTNADWWKSSALFWFLVSGPVLVWGFLMLVIGLSVFWRGVFLEGLHGKRRISAWFFVAMGISLLVLIAIASLPFLLCCLRSHFGDL